ncbi:hypothetical protein [Umezawaea sp. Da 62-37]|uniref:hypothetical protein n=1 Tax=Umezawaea sp. Da 62-37 TaxID=3075927 RepID=UPI0028F6C38C|nr:hypothetical protein [Umezawaea sp. Da 62-37]WNV82311.1 hypothetical protein RM788_29365 [Umezawaea sp. Da 62-37]
MTPLLGLVRAGLLALAVGAVAGFVLYKLGSPPGWAAVVALPIAGLVLLVARLPRGADIAWSPLPAHASGATSVVASTLVSRLDEASRDRDRFTTRIRPRLRALAESRLRLRGVTTLAEGRALLGEDAFRLLTDPDAAMPDPRVLAALLDRLEAL